VIPWLDRRRAARASAELTALVAGSGGEQPQTWLGLEHEFLVHRPDGRQVDFRDVVHGLGLGRPHLVANYWHAYRMATGSIVAADGTEAEIATPPTALAPGAPALIDAWAAWERASLGDRVAPQTLCGDSTHVNVQLPDDVNPVTVANLFATRFSAGLMLLMDRPASPGLLVRPRPRRLELGGEYAVGSALRAAIVYAAGATLACVAAVRRGDVSGLPPAMRVSLERNVLRFGWYVARTAFGRDDLYVSGRAARLRSIAGAHLSGGEALRSGWEVARAWAGPLVAPADLADADGLVGGSLALPIEREAAQLEHGAAEPIEPSSAFGAALVTRTRDGFDVAPVMLNWEVGVFLVVRPDRRRSAFLAVRGVDLARLMDALDDGRLDDPIRHYLSTAPSGRRRLDREGLHHVGLFDALGLRASLLSPERDTTGALVELGPSRPSGRPGAARGLGSAA
jgi:hypothetical protein